jgi:hypothetical protein
MIELGIAVALAEFKAGFLEYTGKAGEGAPGVKIKPAKVTPQTGSNIVGRGRN